MIREYFADGLPDLDDPNHTISFDADTIADALVNIYQKKYGNGKEIEPTLFEKTKEIFEGAVNKGVKQSSFSIDTAFKHQLTHNMWVFAAFRTHKMQRDIAKYLLNEKGELKPFTKFVKDITPYIKHTNRLWLETEYNTAVLRAHQAADWRKFVDERDVLPNLEWQPSTSTNPGEDHKPYWFTCLPINHKFWKQHRPGDRWNCKCSLRNTDKEPTPVPADTIIKGSEPQRGLESNPGEKGEIFSNSHPYYPENCGKCPFNKGVGKLWAALVGRKRNCNNGCKKVDDACVKELIKQRKKNFFELREDENYINVKFDKKTGAIIAEHKEHIHHSAKKEDTFFGGLTSTMLERDCQNELFRMGHKAILEKEKVFDTKGNQVTALDLTFDDKPVDIATVTTDSLYGLRFVHKNDQIIRYNKRTDIKLKADSLILYFYEPTFFSEVKMEKSINFFKYFRDNNGELIEKLLKQVHCVIKGTDKIITYNIE